MSSVIVSGDTSGSITLNAPAVSGSSVLTLPVATDTLVGKATTDTLTNKTLTSPVIATIVNSGTLTLPSSTDTLVGKATTDTLTNKSIVATQLTGTIAAARMPTGSVLQVTQTAITASFSTTSGAAVDITGLTATITPISTSSKILVITNFFVNGASGPYPHFFLQRNGSNIFIGDASGSSTRQSAAMSTGGADANEIISVATTYLDSPSSTSAVVYKWQVYTFSSRAVYVGRTSASGDAQSVTVPSTITLMEIAG